MKHLKLLSLTFALIAGTSLSAASVLTSGSWDGAGKNLNHYFAAWGVGLDVNADQMTDDKYWQSILSTGDNAVMLLEVAGHAPLNTFGIFQVGQQGITHTEIFNGAAAAGASASLTVPTGAFGFYLAFQGTYFYSDPNLNSHIGGYDQLASYRGPFGGVTTVAGQLWDQNSYLLAWEDLPYAGSDKDYNDMVLMIRVQENQVPDSGATALMILGGLATLAGLRRKLA